MRRRDRGRYRIRHGDREIEYEIVHRPAVTRRVHLELGPDDELQVVAPRRLSARRIAQSLEQRADRVARFLDQERARRRELPALNYVSGESHLFLGQWYPLDIRARKGRRDRVLLDGGVIAVRVDDAGPDRVRELLRRWYRERALEHFPDRLRALCHSTPWCGEQLPELRVRRMKRTWGSCSAKGRITLNTALVKAPAELVDYVICHEICHLREHNHGPGFYALQEALCPEWRTLRSDLRGQGHVFLHD